MSHIYIHCMHCGAKVSTPVPHTTVVQASVECPDCVKKTPAADAEIERLRAELADLRRLYDVSVERGCDYEAQRNRLREALEWALHKIIPQSLPTAERARYDSASAALEGK